MIRLILLFGVEDTVKLTVISYILVIRDSTITGLLIGLRVILLNHFVFYLQISIIEFFGFHFGRPVHLAKITIYFWIRFMYNIDVKVNVLDERVRFPLLPMVPKLRARFQLIT